MICVIHFALSLPTDTAVPLLHGEDGLLTGENCTGQLNIKRCGCCEKGITKL